MAHPHTASHSSHSNQQQAPSLILIAIAITFVFMIVELVGGYWANSLALLSDAAHMVTDIGAMLLSYFAAWVAKRPRTSRMSYGYSRAEVLGALISGMLIWIVSGCLIYGASQRMNSLPDVEGPVVLVVSLVGLLANLVTMKILYSAKQDNLNVRAAYLHLLSDALGSIAAAVSGGVLWMTGWRPIDPIMTILFSGIMILSSWNLVKEAAMILMQQAPAHLDPDQIRVDLLQIAGVEEIHDLHVWSISSGQVALSAHAVSESPEHEQILVEIHRLLKEKHGVEHSTIQLERSANSGVCTDCGTTNPLLK